MKHLRTIIRTANVLPAPLKALTVPVVEASRLGRREVMGRVEGAVVDEHGRVVFFVVRVHQNRRPAQKRVLLPLGVVRRLERGLQPALAVAWTPDELSAQPEFENDDELPRGTWHATAANGAGDRAFETEREPLGVAVRWSLTAATLCAVVSAVVWGSAGAVAFAVVVGLAAGIAGALVSAAGRSRRGDEPEGTDRSGSQAAPWVQSLEAELRKTGPFEHGILHEATIGPVFGVPG